MSTLVDRLCVSAVAVATECTGRADPAVIRTLLDDAPDGNAAAFLEVVAALQAGRRALGPEVLRRAGLHYGRRAIGLDP